MPPIHDPRPGPAAERYARAGVPVLPLYEARPDGGCACGRPDCDRPGKHPRLPHGVHQASIDPATVSRWWRWWPTANVGAATGHLFDVWDVDLPPDQAGPLLDLHVPGLAAPIARTGGGGTHVFLAPAGLGNRGGFLPGCDWRGLGGYVVLPPSRHASGRAYQWLTGPGAGDSLSTPTPPPPAPPGLLTALTPPPARATPGGGWHAHRTTPYAAAALRRECDTVAAVPPGGGRNDALNRAAFSLGQLTAAGVLDEAAAVAALTAAALAAGLGERETTRTVTSGLTAGRRHPRTRRGAP